jgi:hypothetical protein
MMTSLGYAYLLRHPYREPDQEAKSVLTRLLTAHMVPEVPVTETLWTTPFLTEGQVLQTEAGDNIHVEVARGPKDRYSGDISGMQLKASNGETTTFANLVSGNHEACKVFPLILNCPASKNMA